MEFAFGALVFAVSLAGSEASVADSVQPVALGIFQDVINRQCPIANEAIDGKTSASYNGHKIGFCCSGCDTKFLAWSKEKKDAYVLASLSDPSASKQAKVAGLQEKMEVEPYTIRKCPVSGEPLDSMGEPVEVTVGNRRVKLCCNSCVKRFDANPKKYLEAVDAAFAAQQRPYYMLDTCVVTGEPLAEDGKDIALDVVINNRLFRVCCKACIKSLEKEPARYGDILNARIADAQRPKYPLQHCLVRGQQAKIGSMGEPVELVVGNRLVRLCCKGCLPKFREEPSSFLVNLDAAWKPVFSELNKGAADPMPGKHRNHGEHKEHKDGGR